MKYIGLVSKEIENKQLQYGKNVLPEEKTVPTARLFLSQFANPLVYILCFAAFVSVFLQKYFDVALIMSVVFINAAMGFFRRIKPKRLFWLSSD